MDCERKGKFFGGCNFKPTYDVIPPDPAMLNRHFEAEGRAVLRLTEAYTKEVYRGSYCTRCGRKGEA